MSEPDIEAEVQFFPTVHGGRRTPTFSGYRPQHRVRGDVWTSGTHEYPDAPVVLPGTTVRASITFLAPAELHGSLWVGRVIEIAEGTHVVAQATVTKIFNAALAGPPSG